MATLNTSGSLHLASNPDTGLQFQIDIAYIAMGAIALMANTIVFLVLSSNKKLFKQSAFIFSISLSHFLGSCNTCFGGCYRVANRATLLEATNPWLCVAYPWFMFWSFELQTMGLLLTIVGIERLLAIRTPIWYRNHWNNRLSWTLAATVFGIGIIGGSYGFYRVSLSGNVQKRCQQGAVYGVTYIAYTTGVTSFGGAIAAMATLMALVLGKRRFSKMAAMSDQANRMARQLQMTRTMLTVAFLDFFLTFPPNIALFLNMLDPTIPFNVYMPYFANIAYSINGVANVTAYVTFNREFRDAAKAILVKIGLSIGNSQVSQGPTTSMRNQNAS